MNPDKNTSELNLKKMIDELTSSSNANEAEILAKAVVRIAERWILSAARMDAFLPEFERKGFVIAEIEYLSLLLVNDVILKNRFEFGKLLPRGDQHQEPIGRLLGLLLDTSLLIPNDLVRDRYRAACISWVESGDKIYLSDRFEESKLCDFIIERESAKLNTPQSL